MAFDLSTIGTYSAADKLKAIDHAIMTILLGGQVVGMNGRAITRANIKDLQALRNDVETQASAETDLGGGIALVQYGERV